jgi:membrane protein DedA with SNARE-associated domain
LTLLRRRLGIGGAITPALQQRLRRNATRMLLVGKWTHALGGLVLVGSGMLRLPLPQFILVNLLATVPKSAALFGLGYFTGDHYPFLERHYVLATGVACAAGLASITLILRRTDGIRTGQ